jgi:hypothetical protein
MNKCGSQGSGTFPSSHLAQRWISFHSIAKESARAPIFEWSSPIGIRRRPWCLNGGIDQKMFLDANTEHIFVYAKIADFLPEVRQLFSRSGFPNSS